jgi:trimeric autotransporter adhesin
MVQADLPEDWPCGGATPAPPAGTVARVSRLGRSLALAATIAGVLTAVVAGPAVAPSSAATGDIGYNDGSFAPLGGSPTGTKPESKLWFNDGSWWGILFSPAKNRYEIFKLDRTTGKWSDTGTAVDTRTSSRADVLWDAGSSHLYVASHYFKDAGHGATAPAITSGTGARLYRYTYANGAYTLDAGYPADINPVKTETLVIDKDATGTLWSTWTYGNKVYVNHTQGGNDASWSAPYVVPGSTTLDSDDISSLIHFGGDKVGVMWSDQSDKKVYFSVHADGAGDAAWSTSVVPTGWTADDHINLKADSAGRVYAAVKTSESTSANPLILLLVRGTDGVWKSYVYGTYHDSNTRPIVLLDEQHRTIHMYATGPQPPNTSGQSGGDIVEKTTSMDAIAFAPGAGTPVLRANGSPKMNDATSTKQNVNDATGIVIEANDHALGNYWHSQESLGAGPPPPSLSAAFSGTPVTGTAPLAVQFTDTSTGGPTSWSWTFGDGGTSTLQSPSHTYAAPGTYTVALTVSNGTTSNTTTKVGYVTAGQGGGTVGTVTLQPAADAYVQSGSPTKNYGTQTSLRLRAGSPLYTSYVTFDLSAVTGTVTSAQLRLFATDASPDGGRVFGVPAASWTESGITFDNAPALTEPALGSLGATTVGSWAQLDVTSAVHAGSRVSFGLSTASTNSAYYSSKEGANPPQLVVTTG